MGGDPGRGGDGCNGVAVLHWRFGPSGAPVPRRPGLSVAVTKPLPAVTTKEIPIMAPKTNASARSDIHARVTDRILADLESGVPTWIRPWSAGNTQGRIVRPLRH